MRRAPLVATAVGLTQALLIGAGWLLLYQQTHERVAKSVEDVIVQANVAAAQSIADSLGTISRSGRRAGSRRSRSWRSSSSREGGSPASSTWRASSPVTRTFGTTLRDSSGAQLMVHQPVSGLTAASKHITGGIALLVLGVGAAIFVLTGGLGFLFVRAHSAAVVRWNRGLEQRVEDQTREIVKAHEGITFGIAKLAEYRDNETGMHVDRMCAYSAILARQMREMGEDLTEEWIHQLRVSASLHDIGKVSTPDAILLKPGRLTADEFEIMKGHAATGREALEAVRAHVGPNPLIGMGIEIAGGHHERWDGSGYPHGVAGDDIPLSARIVAVADVFDALMSKRVYKEAMPIEQVEEIIRSSSGGHFDPRVVAAFFAVEDELIEVRRVLHDAAEPVPESPHQEHGDEVRSIAA